MVNVKTADDIVFKGIDGKPLGGGSSSTPGSAKPTAPSSGKPSSGGAPSASPASDDQKNIVRTMQGVMSKLSEQIVSKRAAIFEKNKGDFKTAEEIGSLAATFSNTAIGFSGSASADGIWGGNTQKALNQIISFVKRMNLQGITIVSDPKHNEAKSEEIIKNATANIDNLSKIFSSLNLEAPAEARQKTSNKLDAVGSNLGKEQAVDPLRAPFPSSVPVLKEHLETLLRFFDFIQVNNMRVAGVNCKPIAESKVQTPTPSKKKLDADDPWANKDNSKAEDGLHDNIAYSIADWDYSEFYKLAEEIKNSNIFKAAQDPKTNKETPSLIQGLCVNQFEQLIYWFYTRANALANSFYNLLENGEENPLTKKPVTQADLAIANIYNKMMAGLYAQWVRVKKYIEKEIAETGDVNNPLVSREMIEEYLYGSSGGNGSAGVNQPGAARTRPGKGGPRSFTTPGGSDDDQGGVGLESGPISTWMDFDNLKSRGFTLDETGAASLERLAAHEVNIKDWTGQSGTSWQNLAIMYSKQKSEVAKVEDIQNIVRHIANVITSLYNEWKKTQDPAPEVTRPQFELAKRWTNALRSMGAAAQRQTSDTGSGGRGQVGSYPVSNRGRGR